MSTPKNKGKATSPVSAGIEKITGGYKPVATPKDATGMQGVGITGTDRNVAKEIEAFKLGYSADYIASRGGLNSQGYFNDVALSGQLNAAEQKAVTLANGTVDTPAMARILQQKAYDEAISRGEGSTEVLNKLKNQWGNLYDATVADKGGTGDGTKGGTGSGTGSNASGGIGSNLNKNITDETRDAFAILTNLFASYGLESLAGEISGYMTSGLTSAEALIKLKTNPTGAYAKRFAGNFTRIKNGLNAISEAEYVNLENTYANTLKAYGLGNMVSLNRDDNYKKFADYIAGDISADEFNNRIKTVVERVQNAEPSVKATLKSFYPEITDNDLIGYFLNPKENLPKLQEKVTASEIGAAAAGAGLTASLASATDLAKYGVDQKMAREGYSTISGVLPTATKLGDIYGESGIKYAQAEGEAEVFKGSQDAATKRRRLASMERAAFGGSSGTGQSSLTRNRQGLI
jgi:hypothetical protein